MPTAPDSLSPNALQRYDHHLNLLGSGIGRWSLEVDPSLRRY